MDLSQAAVFALIWAIFVSSVVALVHGAKDRGQTEWMRDAGIDIKFPVGQPEQLSNTLSNQPM